MASIGLSVVEAARRLELVGPNAIPPRGRVSVWSSIGAQLRDPLVVVLLAACVLTLATGDWTDSAVIAFVVLVNTTVGVAQELRADSEITALSQLTAPSVRVRRDGVVTSVPAQDLVPGDLVLLGEGDIVPADGELLEASALLVDESALTGESVPVDRSGPHGERPGDLLSSGTVVVKGRGVVQVTGTGSSSALGRIAAQIDTRVQPTPLQRRLAGLGRVLAAVAVALCAVVLVAGLVRGEPLEVMVVVAISLAVAAVPESLPAVVTLSLALGARRMAEHNAVVRRLPAVETLGSVTVLATDKTGTLTQARMVVTELWTARRRVMVTTVGSGGGTLVAEGRTLDVATTPDVVALLRAGALCNDAALVTPDTISGSGRGLGDPTEVALLAAARLAGIDQAQLDRDYPRVGEVPFESSRQLMVTAHSDDAAHLRSLLVVAKGSPEAMRAAHGDRGSASVWQRAHEAAAELAGRGFRVIAVAAGHAGRGDDWRRTRLDLLGLVAMEDPAKPAARATIQACIDAGIRPVLVTGDHPATARALAVRLGLLPQAEADRPGAVVTGDQVAAGHVPDLTDARVFARTSPQQKLDIVQAWKDAGAVVAMTGDGVNDGPALRRADIGVAMGHRGTEVARQAADLVLADDELGTVVTAVQEGRRVYANIRRFLVFGLAGGSAEILVMLLGPFVGLTLPLMASQILWINLLTHGLTGVAMGAEPAEAGVMRRPPLPPEQSVLGDGLWQRVLLVGSVLALATLGLALWANGSGRAWQSMAFVALTSLQLGVAVGLRPRLVTRQNIFFPAAVAGAVLMVVAGLYLPALQDLLETRALPWTDLVTALVTGVVGWLAARLTRPREVVH